MVAIPKFVGVSKCLGDLGDLPRRLLRTEIDRRADRDRAHIAGLLDRAEHHLIKLVRVCKKFIVVDLYDERDLVRVLSRNRTEHAEGRRDAVASAFDRELDDVLRIEILRVRRKARPRRVLDALIDRQDRQITAAAQAAVVV